jgi:hypothetical protein
MNRRQAGSGNLLTHIEIISLWLAVIVVLLHNQLHPVKSAKFEKFCCNPPN